MLAHSAYADISRRFMAGTVQVQGDARLRAEMRVELLGLGEMFDDEYLIQSACHRFDLTSGHWTDLDLIRRVTARRPAPGAGGSRRRRSPRKPKK